jgi:peptidoglycan/xylan/chitin deacetylase (PgdA/CDA1 family)
MGSALAVGQGLVGGPGPDDVGPIGYPATLDLLDELGLKATFFVEGWNALHNPDAVRAIASRGHEVAAHGWVHEATHALDAVGVERVIADSLAAFAGAGVRPRGFRAPGGKRGPHLLTLLDRHGFTYDGSVDHGPTDPEDQARHPAPSMLDDHLVGIPWQWRHIDYYHYYMHPAGGRTPAEVERHFREAIDEIAGTDGFLTLIFHAFVSGHEGERLDALRAVLKHAAARDDVSIQTAGDVAAAVRSAHARHDRSPAT